MGYPPCFHEAGVGHANTAPLDEEMPQARISAQAGPAGTQRKRAPDDSSARLYLAADEAILSEDLADFLAGLIALGAPGVDL